MNWRRIILLFCWLSWPLFTPQVVAQVQPQQTAVQQTYWQLDIKGPIGSGTADFIVTELVQAEIKQPAFILLTLDTPGGLYDATRSIISAILASNIPVVVYVAPNGARAVSAGTYILYASHVAAMAPGTHLGAATPVQLTSQVSKNDPIQPTAEPLDNTDEATAAPSISNMERKIRNDAVAYIRSLAQLRGRNAEWAELAVREAATLTAAEALNEHVIELIADDIPTLITMLNGRQLTINDSPYTFATANLATELNAEQRLPNWRQQFIITISNPNITYLLLLIGVYGLVLEFMSPGFGVAGISGAICLLLAAMALQMLPFSSVGLGLLALGLVFIAAEAITPTLGVFGLGGVVAFVMGSVLLFDTPDKAFRLAWPLIAAFTLVSLGLMLVVVRLIIKQRHQPVLSGIQTMVGLQGEALTDIAPTGYVMVQGERWQAQSTEPISAQQTIVVLAVHLLVLEVRPLTQRPAND
ncbi:NfeD family protein [Oceanisphaera sp. W20_SRM_FM3]|uniref:NfeD family protein n=1 Tax=Oceanisphaera sp. W20_SRM_FM3 TaxID=3240267 RepID=UPI003F9C65C4